MEIIPIGKQIWCDNVDTCSSVSRLHMLLGLLDSCVKWEKSAENSVSALFCSRLYADNRLLQV